MTSAHHELLHLPGGPRLAVATLAESECASLSIYIPAGSRHETHDPAGLAHFVEHMVFKGTAQRSARELSIAVENLGGQINACTSEEHTVYEGRGDADLLPILADVLSDMVWHASFPESEIQLEREVIGEEITMYRESPADHIGDLISEVLWRGHPLGHAISGSLESIEAIDRNTLTRFRDSHYFRSDLVIAAAGPWSIDEVLAQLSPHLPQQFTAPEAPAEFQRLTTAAAHLREPRDTDQLQLALAWHAPDRYSDARHALRLLSVMLGETASSRLFLGLREERGLCYQVGSDVTFFADTGAFEINAGLDPESRDEALATIFEEIADLVKNGPREQELSRAKRLTISQSKLAFESTAAHAMWVGETVLEFGELISPKAWREQISAVTAHDVQAAAELIFAHQQPAIAEITPNS